MDRIYLDYNATTPVRPEVLEAMLPFLKEGFGNPSSIHQTGQVAKKGIDEAREKIARLIHADPLEIVFTGSGTEADNLAVKGIAYGNRDKGRHIISSSVEHHAVLNTCQYLETEGFRITLLPVDRNGSIDPDQVKAAITEETILISLMHSNNEVGTIQPIEAVSRVIKEGTKAYFHTDAVQSIGKIQVDVKALGVDLLSMSAHKVYGPKGIGALYVKKGTPLTPLLHGGHHEANRRAGTENVAGIVGFGRAAELAALELEETGERIQGLRDYFWAKIQDRIPHVSLNGHPTQRLPNTLNVSFDFTEGESMVINLDLQGISASTGSACTSGGLEPSHVLTAMGIPRLSAQGSLRFSIGKKTTREEIDRATTLLEETVSRLRAMSPQYADWKKGRK